MSIFWLRTNIGFFSLYIYLFLIINENLVWFLKLVINHTLFSFRFQLRIALYINCLLLFIVTVKKEFMWTIHSSNGNSPLRYVFSRKCEFYSKLTKNWSNGLYNLIHHSLKLERNFFWFYCWERRSLGNKAGSIMMYRLVLLKTMGTKFVFSFRAILAPDHEILLKFWQNFCRYWQIFKACVRYFLSSFCFSTKL